jgi:phage head maturation protease
MDMIERAFAVDDVAVKERIVVLRAVPYNRPSWVRDKLPGGGYGKPYRESWEKGVFRNDVKAPNRVKLIVGTHQQRHDRNPAADVGHGIELVERDDGLISSLKVTASMFGDHLLAKLDDGEWQGVSVGTVPLRSRTDPDGTVVRTLAHLDHILLTDDPQIPGAQVLGVRDDPSSRLAGWLKKYPLRSA